MTGESGSTLLALVDSNVLVYMYDRAEAHKQPRAIDVLDRLGTLGLGAISTQVLGEFYTTVTRKIPHPLTPSGARDVVTRQAQSWTVLTIEAAISLEAVRGCERYGFHYWDAQLWATALANRVPIILTEDFEDGREIEGVTFVDPFAEGFDLERVLSV